MSDLLPIVQGYLSANWIEVVGVTFAVVAVWLTVKQNVWCWPVGIVCNVFFMAVFIPSKLYADTGLQVVYVILSFYGWYLWLYGDPNRPRLPVSRTGPRLAVALLLAGVLSLAILTYVLWRWTDTDVALWDAGVTVLCLIAQWMLGHKKIENWWVWIVSNVLQIGLYTYKANYLTAALQPLLIAMSILGYLAWRRELLKTAPAS